MSLKTVGTGVDRVRISGEGDVECRYMDRPRQMQQVTIYRVGEGINRPHWNYCWVWIRSGRCQVCEWAEASLSDASVVGAGAGAGLVPESA